MEEIWKDIKGFEGLYQVSNLGRVKSLERDIVYKDGNIHHRKERIMKPRKVGGGYYQSTLYKDNTLVYELVHRLMAEAFLPNTDNFPCVNHKDCNPANNYIHINEDGSVDPDKSNLEFCTQSYNINYADRNKKVADKLGKPVLQFSLSGDFIKEYKSAAEAHRQTGINKGNIGECCRYNKKYTHAGGFIWRYKNIA